MKSDMENKEWADEYMSLKQVNSKNPFTVPAGYFEVAGDRILSLVKLQKFKKEDADGFSVPQNYFDTLQQNILSRVNIEHTAPSDGTNFNIPANYFEELTDKIQSRINIEQAVNNSRADFEVPENYFDQLAGNIQSRINISEFAEDEGFTVPENYFNDLHQQVTARIAVDELIQTNTETFTVPANYFEQLNKNIVNKTIKHDDVLRKTIVRKLFASNTFKYATAACLALVLGAGYYLNKNNAQVITHDQSYLHQQLSEVPVDEIKNYLELHIDATDTHGMMDNNTQINTDALDQDLRDYVDIN
ncbi:hypothetical protein [Mucilaginibacter segetis]|uniref:Uncharacterized protein n=1 Tax=Mucilaginibacter segetis TaxID=2793071 RepID=A0A934PUY3_9SPHI|nr:hypothetical protein [Mucilaginibacter segetis]MBK0380519.1 hypothetical protein [Mucilaginibacter segetis]